MALDPLTAALDIGGKLIDKLWPDPAQRDVAKLKLLELQQNGELAQLASETTLAKGQLDVNAAEAANPKLFVSGWRPAVGWVCVLGFFVQFVVAPSCTWLAKLLGHDIPFPNLDISTMMPLLIGMLGLGGLRTAEKFNGVAAK